MVKDGGMVVLREYNPLTDFSEVERVERRCEVGSSGKLCIFTDLLGDPLCRIRHSPAFRMLVAETITGEEKQIVGMIRGSMKMIITCGQKQHIRIGKPPLPVYTKVGYILGLRVSPSHRRLGIGMKLVHEMEQWFVQNRAEYSYMATENDNHPSLNLFTRRCDYLRFRSLSVLVQPVYAHRIRIDKRVTVLKIPPTDAELLYRRRFSGTEFFPKDINAVLNNKLNLGTFLVVGSDSGYGSGSWAMGSIWNSKEVYRLEVRGASRAQRALAGSTRAVDRALPWLGVPSVPKVFRPFGMVVLYGVGGGGPRAGKMVAALCWHAHNIGRELGCQVVVTEVARDEPVREAIPHWKRMSCAEDVWCVKKLKEGEKGGEREWSKTAGGVSIFVDPREF